MADAALHTADLGAIAVELDLVAHREALGLELLEIEAARHPTVPLYQTAVEQARMSATLTAQAARIFRRLLLVEAQARQLLHYDGSGGAQ
jgi:hypothetical protein